MDSTPLQRALSLAPERATPGTPALKQEFFCFRIGELQLGVPSLGVREVVRSGPLTALPRVPSFVLGVCGVRGEVLPVLDLLRFLGKGETRMTPRTRLFVAMSGNYLAAVATDAVLGLRLVKTADILPPPMGAETSSEHLLGVVQSARNETLALLNLSRLLNVAQQRAVGA